MTNSKTETGKHALVAGDRFHVLRPGVSFNTKPDDFSGMSLVTPERGDTITVTDDLIEATQDRFGNTWLDLVDDPEAQAERWAPNGPFFARGPAPENMTRWVPGTIDQVLEFEARKQVIHDSIRDPQELALALRELQRSPLGQNLPNMRTQTFYDREAPKNGRSTSWDVE